MIILITSTYFMDLCLIELHSNSLLVGYLCSVHCAIVLDCILSANMCYHFFHNLCTTHVMFHLFNLLERQAD